MFVANLADNDFQQILHGGQAGGVAVFVHHDHHVRAFLLHLAHEVVHRLGFGHEADGAHQFPHAPVLALLFFQFEHVAHMDEADNLVDILLEDRDARVLLRDDELAQMFERGLGRDGDDIGPRRHDFADYLIAELHDRLDEFAVFLLDQPLFGAGRDQRVDIFRRRGFLFLGGWIRRASSTRDWKKPSTATDGRAIHASARSIGTRGSSQRAEVRR